MAAREAREVCSAHGYEVAEWCGSTYDDCLHEIRVQTPDGEVVALSGDWIIREPDGSFRVGGMVRQGTQMMGALWVSFDLPPDCSEDQVLEVQRALVTELRKMMTAAGIDPAKAPSGAVTMRMFPMRCVPDTLPGLYAPCDTEPDRVRFVVDYTG